MKRAQANQMEAPYSSSLASLRLPISLSTTTFDYQHAASFQLGKKQVMTLVPPRSLFAEDKPDLETWSQRSHSWLVVLQDPFGHPIGQEAELTATDKKGELRLRILRSSGRPIAEGVVSRRQPDRIQIKVRLLCGKGKREIEAFLSSAGKWQVETAGIE